LEPILVAAGVVVEVAVDSTDDGATDVSSDDGTTEVSSEDGTTEVSSEDGTVEVSDATDSTDGVVDSTDGAVEDSGVEVVDVVPLQAANMVMAMTSASKTTSAFFFMRKSPFFI